MFQFFLERNQADLYERIEILTQIKSEFASDFWRPIGILITQHLNCRNCVEEKMRLNLCHHDLNALLRHERLLMLTDEPEMQPQIIEYAVADDGNGKKCDRKF